MRTLNGDILVDEDGDINEATWLNSMLACYELLKGNKKDEDRGDNDE